ncbi:hypothetical protein [Bacillus sp. AK128]
MKKTFEVTYEGHHILVENTWFHGERLFVNGELQDETLGFAGRVTLTGVLKDQKGTREIKAHLGGNLSIHCRIFIDHQLVFPR